MEALIENGRDRYISKDYPRALRLFTQAMSLCPCTRGMKRKRCPCKDYEATAASKRSIFVEAMYTCVCDVGKTFNKCDNPLHLKALDYRVATFEAMKNLDRAMADATWMLELAPRQPDGYLRAGKVARLQQNAWLAWKIYCAGVDVAKENGVGSPRKLQQLYAARQPLQYRFKRKDPMCLPLEILHAIFSQFDVVTLTRCLRVSRVWKRTLECRDCQSLWRLLVFVKPPPRPPSNTSLQKLVARSGRDVRQVIIKNPVQFMLTPQKLVTLLSHSKNLQRLELGTGNQFHCIFPQGPAFYQHLRHVSLDDYNSWEHRGWYLTSPGAGDVPIDFLKGVAGTLEHLNLVGVPPSWCHRQDLPEFTNLKVLRLEHKFGPQVSFPIFLMASKTARLEQLCLRNVQIDDNHANDWKHLWDTLWSRLKVLVFTMPCTGGDSQSVLTISNMTLLNSINSGNGLEHLDLEIQSSSTTSEEVLNDEIDLSQHGLADEGGFSAVRYIRFLNLRSLRLKDFVSVPEKMDIMLAENVHRGKLHSFDIVFPLEDWELPMGQLCAEHLEGYTWLRGLESIRCLGVSQFRFRQVPTRDEDLPLLGFLASFPNLETLSISSLFYHEDEFCFVVRAIIRVTNLKTIFQTNVHGARLDQLIEVADEYGVKIIHGERPRQWPVPLDE